MMFIPGVAQAAPSVMKISSSLFPSGTPVPGGMSGAVLVSGGKLGTLTAPEFIYQPPTSPSATGTVYEFMFWDINAVLKPKKKAAFIAPGGTIFQATAWYLATGGGGCVGICPTAVTTWAFSLNAYKVLPESPIASVAPAVAWTSPSTSVSTATAVNIAASEYIGTHTLTSFTRFKSWFVFGGGSATTSGLNLSVPAGISPYAIAFYLQGGLPPKPKCKGTECI
ncbi:MAG TPA: hypothetical protein VNY52_07175 [Solirubrobacteraceae bacterium]|nr:hypothetical protein [Solirubrobacteraceae bacterium]